MRLLVEEVGMEGYMEPIAPCGVHPSLTVDGSCVNVAGLIAVGGGEGDEWQEAAREERGGGGVFDALS